MVDLMNYIHAEYLSPVVPTLIKSDKQGFFVVYTGLNTEKSDGTYLSQWKWKTDIWTKQGDFFVNNNYPSIRIK